MQFMQGDGLFQCTALQHLCLIACSLACSTAENTLDITNSPARLSGSLSTLTQLTDLQLAVCSILDGEFECPWLPKLTAVKRLSLIFARGTVRVNLTDQLLSLTKLQFLGIDQAEQTHAAETFLSLEVSWHLMPMLQTVCFGFRLLKLDHRVLGLMMRKTAKDIPTGDEMAR